MTFWKEEGAGRQRQRHVDSSGGARGPTALSSPTTCPRVQPGPTRCDPGQPSTHVPREWARRTCEMTVPDEGSVLAASLLPPKRRPAAQSGRQQSGTPPVIRQQRGASNNSGNKHDTVRGPRSRRTENEQKFVLRCTCHGWASSLSGGKVENRGVRVSSEISSRDAFDSILD